MIVFPFSFVKTSPGISEFTSFLFETANKTGRTGPSLLELRNYYDTSAYPWVLDNEGLNMLTDGIQLWAVPVTGTYRITAKGAQGAPIEAAAGGRGAIITGEFNLTAGEKLQILVGQIARPGATRIYRSSPGGGGSFVIKYTGETNVIDDILLIAGGGGGTGNLPIDPQCDAQIGTSGGRARRNNFNFGGAGGIDGNGGNTDNATANGPGGGFLTNGATSSNAQGLSFLNGGLGGAINTTWNLEGGGFGGGGSPNNGDLNRFSGGGGFSGGGASNTGGSVAESNIGGGGGGSYNIGESQLALGGDNGNYGSGSVFVELL